MVGPPFHSTPPGRSQAARSFTVWPLKDSMSSFSFKTLPPATTRPAPSSFGTGKLLTYTPRGPGGQYSHTPNRIISSSAGAIRRAVAPDGRGGGACRHSLSFFGSIHSFRNQS